MPGSRLLFVAEQSGRILAGNTAFPGRSPVVALDLRRHHRPLDGILGFTFHPGFATNRFVLINYNEPGNTLQGAFVSRFTLASLDPPIIDPGSERVILRWPGGGHNGCTLAFGRDGMLYVSTGDQGSPDPPDGVANTGQDISDLLGSILRIDVDRATGTNSYSIPADNPFLQTPGARPEVYAFGFRNPFRMSFDSVTGELWVGDVGWELWEMIYRVVPGGNYGWSLSEGPNPDVRKDVKPGPGPVRPAMVALPHSEAASITGGQVYRGRRLSRLHGAYVYGDWETGKFWALRNDGDRLLSNDELCDTPLKPVSFALDPDGELLILDYGGGLYEFVPNVAAGANRDFPTRLSQTGLFAVTSELRPAPGVVPYHPRMTMWNDHARIEHHLGVPGNASIVTTNARQTIAGWMWHFPSNTVFSRTASLTHSGGVKRIETQLLHFDGQAWNPYTYRWKADQSDGDLVFAGGEEGEVPVKGASGQQPVSWRFPSRAECLRCHNSWAGETLSFNWLQLPGSERQRLASLGVLDATHIPSDAPALPEAGLAGTSVENRARMWLHANCSSCHRFGAGGAVALHLDFQTPPHKSRALDQKPSRGDFGLIDARIIAPGDPYRSTLFYRISTEGAGHMPPVGSRQVDEEGVRWVGDWIRAMKPAAPTLPSHVAPDVIEAALERADHFKLLSTVNGALALAVHLRVGDAATPPAAAVHHSNPMVASLFQRFLPPDQRRRTLGADFNAANLLAMAGDPVRGSAVFLGQGQCSRCHVHAGSGRGFGPDLSLLARKYNRAQILEHIIHPSRIIAPEYRTVRVALNDGDERSGLLVEREILRLRLRDETGTDHEIPAGEIRSIHESSVSAMPEGLLAPLTPQEAADLIEFLASRPSDVDPPSAQGLPKVID